MKNLIRKVEELRKGKVSGLVNKRLKEFENIDDVFNELCFCLMTANFKADKCIEIQREIRSGFKDLNEEELALKLKYMGHRFWPQRARRIVLARNLELVFDRDWLVENVEGLGMKEASHFLRNIGKKDFAIIDFHIIDLLVREGMISKPRILNREKYLEIENILKELAEKLDMNLAELDLYLWYIETGKVLK